MEPPRKAFSTPDRYIRRNEEHEIQVRLERPRTGCPPGMHAGGSGIESGGAGRRGERCNAPEHPVDRGRRSRVHGHRRIRQRDLHAQSGPARPWRAAAQQYACSLLLPARSADADVRRGRGCGQSANPRVAPRGSPRPELRNHCGVASGRGLRDLRHREMGPGRHRGLYARRPRFRSFLCTDRWIGQLFPGAFSWARLRLPGGRQRADASGCRRGLLCNARLYRQDAGVPAFNRRGHALVRVYALYRATLAVAVAGGLARPLRRPLRRRLRRAARTALRAGPRNRRTACLGEPREFRACSRALVRSEPGGTTPLLASPGDLCRHGGVSRHERRPYRRLPGRQRTTPTAP